MILIYKRLLIIVITVIGVVSLGYSQLVTIETKMDTNKIEIGDRAELKYLIEKKSNNALQLPIFSDTLILGVEVLESPKVDSSFEKNNISRIEQTLYITSFKEGMYFIPPQPFILQNNGRADTMFSKAAYLEVVGVVLDTTGVVRDIAGIERAPIIFSDFLPLFAIIVIVVIALAIVYFIRARKNNKNWFAIPEKPIEPAHVVALRELDKLKAQKLWQQEQLKEYYSRLTNIIRTYIEGRYNILAMEKPTSEILSDIRMTGLEKELKTYEFESLLNLADLIKFAKGDASPEENIEHLENAYKLVKSTYKTENDNGVNVESEKNV